MMDALWAFLGEESNQKILAWLGGGLVTAAGGVWAVIQLVWSPKKLEPGKPSEQPKPTASDDVLADRGGFAVAGNISVNNSTTAKTGINGPSLFALGLAALGAVLLAGAFAGQNVTADRCGAAVGGDITGSSIKIENCGNGQ